ncbi:uncharacterized protein PHALS_15167 [Plasmopara halstedii]|uniref:Uncharacterized protein n=1 Tax=Plasmopara halstedii TaxID=4781 RepID=A0A0P1B1X1_PLAHL|nr:uncharacterized protein PHALS_15167 [Plasmopara halstedii]CEG48733.1 hypothetical protein PHALS_15167 [Plasmopara halstedii]|eukprot:XP_024585102.1 hypothetical protein PHALS_15167 [Plasmopara halstedii]
MLSAIETRSASFVIKSFCLFFQQACHLRISAQHRLWVADGGNAVKHLKHQHWKSAISFTDQISSKR